LLGCHKGNAGFVDRNGGDYLTGCLVRFEKLAAIEAGGAGVGADPHGALFISLEREDACSGHSGTVDSLRPASVKSGESGFGAEPHRAVGCLCDGAHTIGRQTVKKSDGAPLMKTCYRCG
jgi:hypothetical protein